MVAIAMWQTHLYRSIVTVGNGILYAVCAKELLEDSWGDPVS
jgi:hypothetical protein